jgi:precorrin-2 dehydrogenase/sirohydrochlorin ferrochelatase
MRKKNSRRSAANSGESVRKPCHSVPPALPIAYYPLFVNLEKRKAAVVGGGKVAERKILSLLKAKADVTVISPDITPRIAREKEKGTIRHIGRRFRRGDVKTTFLVIAATDSPEFNKLVSEEAPCLFNAVDMPSLCNFIVPSVVQRGQLTIAVSTGGISPALCRSIRKEMENIYGDDFSGYLKILQDIRTEAKKAIPDQKQREAFLKSVASDRMVSLLRTKGAKEAGKMVKALLKESKGISGS